MEPRSEVTLAQVRAAAGRIADLAIRTPVVFSDALSENVGNDVWLKLETHQPTGAFKIRGASNRILRLSEEQRRRGVLAASTGNHGRAVAYVARELGIDAVIAVSRLVPDNKLQAIRDLGAELVIAGEDQEDAMRAVTERARCGGGTVISPFDDPDVIAGQGTIGLEMAEQIPDLEVVLVPLSGGGLASGIAVAVKALMPQARVIGVSMERGAAMFQSQRAGRVVDVEEVETLADSLGGGIGADNAYTFTLVRDLLDDIVLVSEEEIAAAIRELYVRDQIRCEGGAAVGVAALLGRKVRRPSGSGAVGVVVSGLNIADEAFREVVGEALTQSNNACD